MTERLILLVEDHYLHRVVLEDELEDFGFQVRSTESPEEARSILQKTTPDLLVLDMLIRGNKEDTLRLVREVRNSPTLNNIPILFVTAHLDDEMKMELEGISVSDIVAKPFDSESLLTAVRRLIVEA